MTNTLANMILGHLKIGEHQAKCKTLVEIDFPRENSPFVGVIEKIHGL